MSLTQKTCVPCEGTTRPLTHEEALDYLKQVAHWTLDTSTDALHLKKTWKFKDFKEAMGFVEEIAGIAEAEGHHPDIAIHYNEVTLNLWTHAINGLSENDFIVAAKADQASPQPRASVVSS